MAGLGEQEVLRRLQRFCPPAVIGDDGAAVLWRSPDPTQNTLRDHLVVTTDVLVDGVHFSDRTTPPHSVGWRAAAANLSDLAAMGAIPMGLTVGLALPGTTPWPWVEALYQGLTDCGDRHGAPILGGDLCRSSVATVSITALGQAARSHLIRRNALRPGDILIATGVHGASRAGLDLLLNPEGGATVSEMHRKTWVRAHQYPQPRLDWLPPLRSLQGVSTDRAIAGMDSSDGLGDAVVQLARASGCGVALWGDRLPMPPGLVDWVGPEMARDWLLYGGEDFELVLGMPERLLTQLEGALPYVAIGQAVIGEGVTLLDKRGGGAIAQLSLEGGFQHFG